MTTLTASRDNGLSMRDLHIFRYGCPSKVNQVKFNSKKQSPKQQQQPSRKKEKSAKTRSRCPKCGGFAHREGQACRAEGQRCNLCSKTGHFANCCLDKQANTAEVKAVSELDEEIDFLLEVSAVEDSSNLDDDEGECRRRWTAEIQVNGKQVKFKLDSQADVTCVPLCLFKKIMGQQRLVESDINIRAAEFSELQTVGMFISTLRNGNYEIKEKIYVIRLSNEPLLSRRACELLNLARRIEVVATRINPIKEFPEVFEGLGQIGNPYEIKLKPGAKPYAVHTPRRVPIPLMENLKTRLEELEKAGIIAQVNVATEWRAPTVIAGKPNGDIRLCVDLSRLNEHLQREVHPMPVVEHMLGQLGEARFFSKLDANIFSESYVNNLARMDSVMCYLDDILIFASDSKTHDRILLLVLRKLKEAKVTLNKAKCVFGVPRINFLGHILDEDGIRPDPAKIEAVAKMPAPTDVHGVRRFLGMVNHLGRLVENLSEIMAPLNKLLVKGQDFVWDCSQERAFRRLKELLTTQPILAAYDVRKPTMVSSDASSYGLGAVLKQEGKNGIWRPVAYSSRTMTPTEKRYAQIEKEALAITWACERFQYFLLGNRFRIETEHKPLIPLFSTKELSSLTPRLQRFRMRMMRFGFEIVHIPGKELLDADALSRQPLLTTEGGENERPTSAHINAVLSCITDKDEMLTKIFEAQQEDTTLKAVVNYLEQGWPNKKKMPQALLSYWHEEEGACWIVGDFNIRDRGPSSSSSSDALAALLDLAALVDVATQFDAAHLPTRVARHWNNVATLIRVPTVATLIWSTVATLAWNNVATLIWSTVATLIWSTVATLIWSTVATLIWSTVATLAWNNVATLIWSTYRRHPHLEYCRHPRLENVATLIWSTVATLAWITTAILAWCTAETLVWCTTATRAWITTATLAWCTAATLAWITSATLAWITPATLATRLTIKSKGDTLSAFLSFGIKCSKCGKQGHRRASCPLLARQTSSPRQAASHTDASPPPPLPPPPPSPPPPQQPRRPAPAPATPASPVTPAETSTEAPAIPSAPQPAEPKDLAQPAPVALLVPLAAPRPLEPGIPPLDHEMTEEEVTSTPSASPRGIPAIIQLRKHLKESPTLSIDRTKLHGLDWEDAQKLLASVTNMTKRAPSLPEAQVAAPVELAKTIMASCPNSNNAVYKTLQKTRKVLLDQQPQ
ncbi:K02A2.6-like [Cordylochernes scorpioides]|uniref:K02A2.6-like n=1 Tax=Cordylochernes scorpioides TaxID=51811 RepID=A0ABY6KCY4_9ARAC|nr:K02A2.6-like [Cordylochernes scorpioides]